ncbi:glutaredoxin [Marasmius fiardii PR-910]|nr:glutaredoxin [Marasmius fiardii PR-910]
MSLFNHIYRFFSTSSSSSASLAVAKEAVESIIQENKVAVFSKSWCPFCHSAKSLFTSNFPNASIKVIELDQHEDGSAIQAYLLEKTGQRTVPNIFVNRQHVGGNDDAHLMFKRGQLAELINPES